MAKFKEIVYMVLDLLKESGDDSFYTEEHVIFLASKMRALLLDRKYKNSRNQSFSVLAEENRQQICIDLEPTELLQYGCSGMWLKSTKQIPDMMGVAEPRISTVNDMLFSHVTFIPAARMPYVGYNKWLGKIIYASRSDDGYLYLSSNNPQFVNLEQVKLSGVFSNAEEAASLSCDGASGDEACDILDKEFPLEDALIPNCIELVVQELAGPRYAPQDRTNNDVDDLGNVASAQVRAASPVENSNYRQRYRYPDEQQA